MSSTYSRRQATGANGAVDAGVDYYKLLDVPYTATRGEITRAYREAIKRSHPDRQQPEDRAAAEEHAKLLNRAYATLSRADARRAYDATLKAQLVQDQIMASYFGGFGLPGSDDPFAERLRRASTAGERREQQQSGRDATMSILVVFGAVTLAVLALLILWAIANALLGSLV
jgi:DnaJ-class molecular chaperone